MIGKVVAFFLTFSSYLFLHFPHNTFLHTWPLLIAFITEAAPLNAANIFFSFDKMTMQLPLPLLNRDPIETHDWDKYIAVRR